LEKKLDYYYLTRSIIETFGTVLFAFIIIMQGYNIFGRFTKIYRPFMWVEELTRYSFIWIVFLFWPLLDRHEAHFVVDIVPSRLSGVSRQMADIFAKLVGLVFAVLVVWFSIIYIPHAMIYCTDSFRNVPQGVIYMVIPVGLALVFVEKVRSIIQDVKDKK
jgi:C4-dicarboxylate transporter DctQ subunit